jgi:hypothetical protein
MNQEQNDLVCVYCQKPVMINRDHYDVFEHMHWLCFHLAYEHDGDPDGPCADPSCPWWHVQVFRAKLSALGYDPQDVLGEAITARWNL